jgi:hypothetical protein
MKKIFIIISLFLSIYAKDIKPSFVYKASGGVTSLAIKNNNLYVATDASSVDIFNIKTKKLIKKIKLPQITDFMGDIIDAKIYNIDILNKMLLITVQAKKGFREIYLYKQNKLTKIIDYKEKMFISKANFIDKNNIIFSLLGNEFIKYNLKSKKYIYRISISASKFSDFSVSKDKTKVVIADESGDLKLLNIQSSKIINTLEGQNLDNVFKVDFKNNKIITAGQDRKSVVYNLTNNTHFYKKANFLIYSASLSPKATRGAYSNDEENNVIIFDIKTKKNLYNLTKNKMTISDILFINKNEIFIATDSNKLNYYNLKDK